MKASHLTNPLLLCAALASACSSLPERPGSNEQGSGGYAQSRNQACLIEAQRAWEFGKYAETEQALSRWQGPMEDPRPLTLLGQVSFAKKQFGLAAELFARGLEFAPTSISLTVLTAQSQEAAGQWEAARTNYARTLHLQSNHEDAAVGLLRSYVALAEGQQGLQFALDSARHFSTNTEFLSLAADLAFAEGDFEHCIEWSRTARLLQAKHPGGEERLILALAWTGQHDAAVLAAARADSRDWAPEVHRAVGRSSLALGDGATAARHFQSYLAARGEDSQAWLDLARAHFLNGNADQALASADQALSRNEALAPAQLLRAHCLFRLGQDQEAASAYSASLALGASENEIQPFLDLLVMREGNSLQAQPASSAKDMAVSPKE